LLTDAQLRRRMAEAAPVYARAEHDLPVAAARIDAVLRGVTERGALRAGADAIPPTAR
jgi:hypothetical protein